MKFECKDLDRALEVPELMSDAREHARDCPVCSRDLWIWGEMSKAAPGLREEWDTPALWPSIRSALAAEPKRLRAPRRNWKILGAIAAALLVMTVGVSWYELGPRSAGSDPDFLTEQTLREVEQAESAYRSSIDKLARIAQPKLDQPDSALIAAYREKLQLLDAEIADLRLAIDHNRFNTRLQTELATLYREKKQTLQEIVNREQKN